MAHVGLRRDQFWIYRYKNVEEVIIVELGSNGDPEEAKVEM